MFLQHQFSDAPDPKQYDGSCHTPTGVDGALCGRDLIDHVPDEGWWVVLDIDHPTMTQLWVGPYATEAAAEHSAMDGMQVEILCTDTKAPYAVEDVVVLDHPVATIDVFKQRLSEEVYVMDPFNPDHEYNWPH